MPTIQVPGKFRREQNTTLRFIILIGGRGSAKPKFVARLCIMRARTERADILCGLEFESSIDDSLVFPTLGDFPSTQFR